MEVTGTFFGHVGMGSAATFLAVGFIVLDVRRARAGLTHPPTPGGGWFLPTAMMIAAGIGFWLEKPGGVWPEHPNAMAYQHMSVAASFVFAGLIDFAVQHRRLPNWTVHAGYGAIGVVGFMVFAGHANSPGIETLSHRLLASVFGVMAIASFVEPRWAGARTLRQFAWLWLGAWLMTISWTLYKSGWEIVGMVPEMWTWTFFIWCGYGAFAAILAKTALMPKARSADAD